MALRIEDYALIGDRRGAALVGRDGSIDWLCLPRFDSPACLAALLGTDEHGCWRIEPIGDYTVERRYVGDTTVLETTFRTPTGVVRLVDFVAVADEEEKRRALRPDFTLGRRIECLTGEVEVEAVCDARPDYGRMAPRVTGGYHLGYILEYGARALVLRGTRPAP